MKERNSEIKDQLSKVENTTGDLNMLVGKMLRQFAELGRLGLTPQQRIFAAQLADTGSEYVGMATKQMEDFAELQRMIDDL